MQQQHERLPIPRRTFCNAVATSLACRIGWSEMPMVSAAPAFPDLSAPPIAVPPSQLLHCHARLRVVRQSGAGERCMPAAHLYQLLHLGERLPGGHATAACCALHGMHVTWHRGGVHGNGVHVGVGGCASASLAAPVHIPHHLLLMAAAGKIGGSSWQDGQQQFAICRHGHETRQHCLAGSDGSLTRGSSAGPLHHVTVDDRWIDG